MKQDEINTLRSDAKKEGIAIGEERGKVEGIALKARETALNAIDMGLTMEQAVKLSGLSIEEVKKLGK
jgi:predicted transposase YdaD